MQAIQMNVRIEPQIKSRLEAEAQRRGLSIARYLNWLLAHTLPELSPKEPSNAVPEKIQ